MRVLNNLVNTNALAVRRQFHLTELSLETRMEKKITNCTAVLSDSSYLATVKIQPKPQRCLKLYVEASAERSATNTAKVGKLFQPTHHREGAGEWGNAPMP